MDFVKTQPGKNPIIVEGYFAAPPAKLFRAWTDPERVMQWFGQKPNSLHSASIDLRPGGIWQFVKVSDAEKISGFEGQYLEIEDGKRLVFSWAHVTTFANGLKDATPFSRVDVTFLPKGKGTAVLLVHSLISTEDARRGIGGGWNAAFSHLAAVFGGPVVATDCNPVDIVSVES